MQRVTWAGPCVVLIPYFPYDIEQNYMVQALIQERTGLNYITRTTFICVTLIFDHQFGKVDPDYITVISLMLRSVGTKIARFVENLEEYDRDSGNELNCSEQYDILFLHRITPTKALFGRMIAIDG